jgi:methylmalonyl-CoA/ethylmalonyl-CoA epimerase
MFHLFSHVGVVVRDLDSALAVWRDVLGLEVVEEMEVVAEGVRSVFLSTGGAYGETACVELVQPLDAEDLSAPITRWLAEHGEGVYHLAFRARSAELTAATLAAAGLAHVELGPAGDDPGRRVVVHPKAVNGVLVEVLHDEHP